MDHSPGDALRFTRQHVCRLRGPLGQALERCVETRLKTLDYELLRQPFLSYSDDGDDGWRGEFWGKNVRAAILAWRSLGDAELLARIRRAVDGILEAVEPDGTLSCYSPARRLRGWDLWGRKYALLGLERYWALVEPDPRVARAIGAVVDRIIDEVDRYPRGILATGRHGGLASSSLIGAVVGAWRITGRPEHLAFARSLVDGGCSSKHDIFSAALRRVLPAEIGDAKAYEMLSCFKGASEMHEQLSPRHVQALRCLYELVRDHEIMVSGTAGATNCGEYWYNGRARQTWTDAGKLGETCITVTWIQYAGRILAMGGDDGSVGAADEMERAAYNALLGAMTPDGSNWTHRNPTPLSAPAPKIPADDQMLRNFGTPFDGNDCCRAQGPEGLAQIARYAVMNHPRGVALHFFEALDAVGQTPSGADVGLRVRGGYPFDGKVDITLHPDKPERFAVFLRIPGWWNGASRLRVAGGDLAARAGHYLCVERTWRAGDRISMDFDLATRRKTAPGDPRFAAFFRGPVLMARDSRLGGLERPVPADDNGTPQPAANGFRSILRFSDGSLMGDYASSGNLFSSDNPLRVWVDTHAASSPGGAP